MTDQHLTVLVVGATGSVGRHVVATALAAGHRTRALARTSYKAQGLARGAEVVIGDLTDTASLHEAVADIDAVVFTHGDNGNAEAVNYGAVKNVLDALRGRRVRIALMTTIGVTALRDSSEWKRRGERLVRASGNEYTIVRPGWFDHNDADQLHIAPRQGDTHQTGTPADGVIARRQIARVLVDSLTSPDAEHRTFELVADRGPEQQDLGPVFAALPADDRDSVDGAGDADNLPLDQEPQRVVDDLDRVRQRGTRRPDRP
ncbi:SDR family oxidoreductase [Curtobacterium sp. NPDC087082]|uniref:SDR family oxidoreductase n=1 Tax=Curtobacterium sp. NPDC087082 TaxID=3363966 RepID=UPI003821F35A